MKVRGRRELSLIDEVWTQIQEGKSYIVCPYCSAYLADNNPLRWADNVIRQFTRYNQDHVFCPRCRKLIGEAVYGMPTFVDALRGMPWYISLFVWILCAIVALVGPVLVSFWLFGNGGYCRHGEYGFRCDIFPYFIIGCIVAIVALFRLGRRMMR